MLGTPLKAEIKRSICSRLCVSKRRKLQLCRLGLIIDFLGTSTITLHMVYQYHTNIIEMPRCLYVCLAVNHSNTTGPVGIDEAQRWPIYQNETQAYSCFENFREVTTRSLKNIKVTTLFTERLYLFNPLQYKENGTTHQKCKSAFHQIL